MNVPDFADSVSLPFAMVVASKRNSGKTLLISHDDVICECYKCGLDMTAEEVDDIPEDEFDEDCPVCADCREAHDDDEDEAEDDAEVEAEVESE